MQLRSRKEISCALTCVSDRRRSPGGLCALLPLYLCNVCTRCFINTHVSALIVTCRANPEGVPGAIVRFCLLAWSRCLPGQANSPASPETTVLKTRFGPGDAGYPLSRSIGFARASIEQSSRSSRPARPRASLKPFRDDPAVLSYLSGDEINFAKKHFSMGTFATMA